MTITSLYYLLFIAVGALLYYVLPKSWQWVELLVLSILFYCLAARPYTIMYLISSTLIAYIATNVFERAKESNRKIKTATLIIAISIILNVLVWFIFKGDALLVTINQMLYSISPVLAMNEFNGFQLMGALGMGYYTLQIIGYMLDCCWENAKVQRNPLKLFLFVCFFPQLTTGPISRYSQLKSLFETHKFSYENLAFGAQRILWGLFKKIVIAERVGIIVNGIWGGLGDYVGYYHWIAFLLYPIQMYADFSGCMDIVLGTAEIFGIKMPENFNNPFFARNSQEFWQRWHITLGAWAKDYVLYPLLKSKLMIKLSRFSKKKFGKRIGKFIATAVGMFCLWMVMGIWHGAAKYIVGVSLWYWVVLILGDLCTPFFAKMNKWLNIPTETFSWHFFQSLRTYLIYAVGAVFFRATGVSEAVVVLKSLFLMSGHIELNNPWILFDGSFLNLGVTYIDFNILLIGILLLFIVGALREKYGFARSWVAKQFVIFRWAIWIGLFVITIIYGMYGPGYSASEFIYKGF